MALQTDRRHYAAFIKTFRGMARHKHRYDVFRDFVTMAAASLHNAVCADENREAEYLRIIGEYGKEDQKAFPKLLAYLVEMMQPEPRDVLGPLYMELEIASRDQGQFFTPPDLSNLMAQMIWTDTLITDGRSFITLSEPACGAGGMVLAFVKTMMDRGHDPNRRLWVQCVDIDRLAALMCYVQLSLWHIPAEIIVGDTLRLEVRETWHTPAHNLGFWSGKLAMRSQETPAIQQPGRPEVSGAQIATVQMGFDFGAGSES